MRRLGLPLAYLGLTAAGIAAPLYAVIVLLEMVAPGPVSIAEAITASAPPVENAAVQEQAPALHRPVWIAPTRQYNYTPPPLPKHNAAAGRDSAKKKFKDSKKRERKPAQGARQPRATPEAMQALAAEVVPERVINRD